MVYGIGLIWRFEMELMGILGFGVALAIIIAYFFGFWCGGRYMLKKIQETLPRKN